MGYGLFYWPRFVNWSKRMKILIPLPRYGFDPTEVAIPWKILSEHGIEVLFATPAGERATADRLMLTGDRLGLWKRVLKARTDAVGAHEAMLKDASFCNPMDYAAAEEASIDALLLPGGHDKGVKEHLESGLIQTLVVEFFAARKSVAAICPTGLNSYSVSLGVGSVVSGSGSRSNSLAKI